MATLAQLRAYFPTAESDSDAIKLAAKQFGIDPTEIANEVGFKFNKPGFMSDIKRGTGQTISAIGSTARDLGLPTAGKAVEGYGEDIAYRNPSQINTVGEAIRSPFTTAREALGELTPQIGTSIGAGMAGRFVGGAIGSLAGPGGTVAGQAIGGAAGTYLGNLAQSYGGIRAEQREQGIEDKGRAGTAAAGSAFLDTAFGAERVVNKFLTKGSDILAREAGTSLLKNVGKQTAIGVGTESLTEGAQTGIERYGAYKPLTGDEALNEYGLALIKGGIGGGVVRGGLASISGERPVEGGNDIQQAFSQPNVSGTPTTNVVPPVTPPPAPPAATLSPPAVTGGTTDIAQQTQAAAAENQQVQEAQQNLVKREDVFGKVATQYDPANPTSLNIFGQNIEGPRVAPFGDRFAAVFNTLPPHVQEIAQAITQANNAFATPEKPSPLVSFSFNANNPVPSADKAVAALGKVMTKFQIDHVQSRDEAVQILNKLSTTTKGNQLEQLNAIYEALTGQDTDGFTAAQTAKAEKGAKDGKLPVQTVTGMGAVPVQGGTGQANATVDGDVQPSGVQSVGTGGLPEGSLGLQVGQPSGEGIRDGTGAVSNVVGGNAPSQVNELSTEVRARIQSGVASLDPDDRDLWALQLERKLQKRGVLTWQDIPQDLNNAVDTVAFAGLKEGIATNPQETIALIRGTPQGVTNEQTSSTTVNQPGQPNVSTVDEPTVAEGAGPRVYNPQIPYYATDLSHISSTRRVEIRNNLIRAILAPKQERKGAMTLEQRIEMVMMALSAGDSHADIADRLKVPESTIQKQLERLGIVIKPRLTEAQQGEVSSIEERLGIPAGTRNTTADKFAVSKAITTELPVEETANLVNRLNELYKSAGRAYGMDPVEGGKAFDDLLLDAGEAYRSPEFPDGIGAGEIIYLYSHDRNVSTKETAADQQAKEMGAATAEQLEEAGFGTVATGGGSQGAVGTQATSLFSQAEKLQNDLAKLEVGTPEYTAKAEQLAALWNKYAKKQASIEKAESTTIEEGEEDAVQEPSAEEVPVREGAGGGKKVGKGNAKRGKAAGKTEVKPEPKQEAKSEEIKTPAEEWAYAIRFAPELPPYDVLKKDEKTRWDDLVRRGQANLAAAVKIVGEKPQPASTALANEKPETTGTDGTAEAVNSKSAKFMEFTDLEDEVKGISDVREQFADMDIENALDFVSDWQVVTDRSKDAFHGQLKTENGRYIGVLNLAKMSNPAYAAETARHEIAHAVDMTPHGGVYSHQLEMNVEIKNGKVVPVGEVAEEMFGLFQTNKAFTTFLDYPFNIQVHTDLDTNGKIESELFAQIFSIYTNPKYTDYIASVAPKTATFLEEVINDIRTTTALQVQKSTTAATRAIDFRNRYTARRNQRAAEVYGGNRQANEGPFNRRGQGREFTADQVIGALPKPLQSSARSQWTNIKSLVNRGLYASAITEDVIGLAKKYMPSAAKYLQAQYARQGTRLEFEKRIEDILSSFDKLPANLKGEGKGSVNEYIHDSTREKKWGYYPGEQQVGTKLFEVDPDFKERFDAFPPAAQRLIKEVFRHGYEALRLKQMAAENAVNREFDSRIKAAGNDADLLQSLNKEKRQMLKRITSLRNVNVSDPYAYLGRYGDYVVVAKSKEFIAYEEAATGTRSSTRGDSIVGDPQQAKNWLQDNVSNPLHYVVQFAETQGEADDIAAELQATGQYDVQPEDAGIKEANASYAGGSDVHMAVARLRNLAQRQTESTDGKLEKAISDLYLMTVAEASARRSELERKNVSGADKNMMRNLATSGRADAHFLATMEHSDELNDALEAMRNEARNNRKDAMPLYNELYTRYADSMEYSQPSVLAQNLLRMSTLWNLSTSPAYYLQQVLQTSVLSLPYMAGRLGYFRSARAIKRAYGDMSDLVAGLGINDHIDFDKAPADVRFMLKELVNMGKIDIGMDADARARTDEQGALGKVMFKLQGINTRIEAINRATAAIAAYRGYMDRYKGATGADGVRFAADVVSNTHGNYDGFNTPRILQSGGAKVLLQFKRFQIIQLSMLAKLIHTSFKGASAEERAVARASLKYITAHMAVLGGALGVPFVSQAASILSSVFGDEDEPDDYEYKLRRMIGNDAVADLLLRGVPAALGLESIGKRLSMENVASPFGPFVEFNLTSRADAAQMIVGMMGPAVGLGLKFVDALGMMSKGNYYKGLELALPNGIGNAMKSYRFATEGITMRNGDLVMKPEDISMIDAAFQAVGLPTSTITDRQYTQKVVAEFDKFYAQRAGEIKAMYVEGSRQSDAAAMAEARDDWQKLQESRVRNGYKRQSMSELFRAPAEARKREQSVVGGVQTTKSNRKLVEQVSSGS